MIEGSFIFLALQTALDENPPRDGVDFVAYMAVFNQDQNPEVRRD
jgi:hypothetical protein